MKKLLALILPLVLLCGCAKQEIPEETQPEGKTVYVHRSSALVTAEDSTRSDYFYNDQDILTQVVITDRKNEVLARYQVTCDKNGNPIQWASDSTTYTCGYDPQGRIVETCTYEQEVLISSTTYTYSGEMKIRQEVKTTDGTRRTENTYDEKGLLQRQDVYTDDILTGYELYDYDAEGRLLSRQSYDPEGTPGNTVSYTYFEDTAEAQTTTDPQGTVLQALSITYDDQGNVLTAITYDGEGVLISSESHVWKPIVVPPEQPRASI